MPIPLFCDTSSTTIPRDLPSSGNASQFEEANGPPSRSSLVTPPNTIKGEEREMGPRRQRTFFVASDKMER